MKDEHSVVTLSVCLLLTFSVFLTPQCTETNNSTDQTDTDTDAPTFSGLDSAAAGTQVILSWSHATDNITPQLSILYDIYWANSSGGQAFATPNFTTAPGATSYSTGIITNQTSETELSIDTKYFFVVRARDQSGNRDANTTEKSVGPENDSALTARAYLVGETQNGSINPGTDSDYYKFVANTPSTGTYTFLTFIGSTASCSLDTILTLYDTNGTSPLSTNDECSSLGGTVPDPCSCINGTGLIAGETYYIKVASKAVATGNYAIRLTYTP